MSLFQVLLSFKGKTLHLDNVSTDTTVDELYQRVRQTLSLSETDPIKILYKGKLLKNDESSFVFREVPQKTPRLLVMASSTESLHELNAKRSDPTIRGFDNEKQVAIHKRNTVWGPDTQQDKQYKFVKLVACTWQEFGHRAGEQTPHAFAAMALLEKLSTDPGVVAIMQERQLVVNTLGEMDPIDDRLMQKTAAQGTCLLGYNTNHGLRIDVRLRTDDLKGFLPYPQIVATLIHELSHNWVGEHDLLFWTNYSQMRCEYLHKHASLAAAGFVIDGKSSAQVAEVTAQCQNGMLGIASAVLDELKGEMAQHGLSPDMIAPAILERCRELTVQSERSEQGRALGGGLVAEGLTAREAARRAAERRAQQSEKKDKDNN